MSPQLRLLPLFCVCVCVCLHCCYREDVEADRAAAKAVPDLPAESSDVAQLLSHHGVPVQGDELIKANDAMKLLF